MIQNGQKFNSLDLIRAVDELRERDMREHLRAKARPVFFAGKNDNVYNLADMTPDQYANTMLNMYDTQSSAAALDADLQRRGYKTTYRFEHKYKIPGIDQKRIAADAYRLEYFYQNFIAFSDNDIRREKWNDFMRDCDDAARVSYYYAQYIWATNPETRFDYATRLRMYADWGLILRMLLGTAFGFSPRDVHYFVTRHSYTGNDIGGVHAKSTTQQTVFKNWCMNNYGIDTGCLVLHPDSQEKLRKILMGTDTPYATQLMLKYINKLRIPHQR